MIFDDNTPRYFCGRKGFWDFSEDIPPAVQVDELHLMIWDYQDVLPLVVERANSRTRYAGPASTHLVARVSDRLFRNNIEYLSERRYSNDDSLEIWTEWYVVLPDQENAGIVVTVKMDKDGNLIDDILLPDYQAEPWKYNISVGCDSATALAQAAGMGGHNVELTYWQHDFDGFAWYFSNRCGFDKKITRIVIDAYTGAILDSKGLEAH